MDMNPEMKQKSLKKICEDMPGNVIITKHSLPEVPNEGEMRNKHQI